MIVPTARQCAQSEKVSSQMETKGQVGARDVKEEPSRQTTDVGCADRGPEVEQAVRDGPRPLLTVLRGVCGSPVLHRAHPNDTEEKRDIPAHGYPELVGREGLAIPCPILSPLGTWGVPTALTEIHHAGSSVPCMEPRACSFFTIW